MPKNVYMQSSMAGARYSYKQGDVVRLATHHAEAWCNADLAKPAPDSAEPDFIHPGAESPGKEELDKLTADQLRNDLEARGVEIPKGAKKDILVDLMFDSWDMPLVEDSDGGPEGGQDNGPEGGEGE